MTAEYLFFFFAPLVKKFRFKNVRRETTNENNVCVSLIPAPRVSAYYVGIVILNSTAQCLRKPISIRTRLKPPRFQGEFLISTIIYTSRFFSKLTVGLLHWGKTTYIYNIQSRYQLDSNVD